MMLTRIIILTLFLFMSSAFAKSLDQSENLIKLPDTCMVRDIRFQDKKLIMHTDKDKTSQLYILFNNSKKTVLLDHYVPHPSASAGWGSKIKPQHWSALMVAQQNFSLVCANKVEEGFEQIHCRDVLIVCHFIHFIKKDDVGSGTYWVDEDDTIENILKKMKRRSIFLVPP